MCEIEMEKSAQGGGPDKYITADYAGGVFPTKGISWFWENLGGLRGAVRIRSKRQARM